MNNKQNAALLGIIILSGCGTSYNVPERIATQAETDLQTAMVSDDLNGLLAAGVNHPDSKDFIAEYIIFDRGFDDLEYDELCRYEQQFAADTTYSEMFAFMREKREDQIMETISELDIPDIGQYYRSNPSERSFLDTLLRSSFRESMEDGDYPVIRALHNSFANTALSDYVDTRYYPLRDSLFAEVSVALDEYAKAETEMKESLIARMCYDINMHGNRATGAVLTECLEKKLPRNHTKVPPRVVQAFEKYFNRDTVQYVLKEGFDEYRESVVQARKEIIESLLDTDDSYINALSSVKIQNPRPDYWLPMSDFLKLAEEQRKIDWVGVGITAASVAVGFVTGGVGGFVVGLALDGVDMAYSIHGDKKKAEAVAKQIQVVAENMSSSLSSSTDAAVDKAFAALDRNKYYSLEFFKDYVKQNF